MANKPLSQNFSEIPNPQSKEVSGDDINPIQEQSDPLPDPPKTLVEWLARINRRYLALDRSNHIDTS